MSGQKVSEMTAAAEPLATTDLMYVVQDGESKSVTVGGAFPVGGLQPIANNTLLGNDSGSSAVPQELTAGEVRTILNVTQTGADTTYAFRANNLSDLANAGTARTNLGLGTIATQDANNVSITGGSVAATVSDSTVTATGGSSSKQLDDRFGYIKNVFDYGANGDGVTSDNTAFTNAESAGYGVIPKGSYRITSALTGEYESLGPFSLSGGGSLNATTRMGTLKHLTGIIPGNHSGANDALLKVVAVAEGSLANGANNADYPIMGRIQKQDWTDPNTAQIGEINGAFLFVRQGGPVSGTKSSGAGLVIDSGATLGTGFQAHYEFVTTVFDPDNSLAITHQIDTQGGVLNSRDGDYYGLILNAQAGTMDAAIRIKNTDGVSYWGRVIENIKDSVTNFLVDDDGKTRATQINVSGDISTSAWITNGVGLKTTASTYNDTSSSGTVATSAVHAIARPTLTATSSTTYTNSATLYIDNAPLSSTNVTQTNSYGLFIAAGGMSVLGTTNINTSGGAGTNIGVGSTASVSISGTGNRTILGGGFVMRSRTHTAAGAVTVANTDQTVSVNKTVGAATTVNLFSSPATGSRIIISDGKGDANTNNITIVPAAGNIDGSANFVINTAYGSWEGYYDGTIWKTVSSR